MKVISFSLYGDSQKYIEGAVRNAELAKIHYPGWQCVFYIDAITKMNLTVNQMERLDWAKALPVELSTNPSVIPAGSVMPRYVGIPPMFWRFMVADNSLVQRFIIRDADSRIGPEEAAAVQEWINEDTILHTCRSHPAHCRPINGGMWGAQWRRPGWEAPRMETLIRHYLNVHAPAYQGHDHDQHFLGTMIWPMMRHSCTQHAAVCRSAYPGSKPFPVKWTWPRFMGEVWEIDKDGNESPRAGDWESIPKE